MMTMGRQGCALCLLGAAVGCGSAGSEQPAVACVGEQSAPLVNGDAQESYLGLAESQQRAVVQIVDRTGGSAALCSGVFVTPEWVATAAHCIEIPNPGIAIQAGSQGPSALIPVVDSVTHPERDIALLRAGFSSPDSVFDGQAASSSNFGGSADATQIGVSSVMVAADLYSGLGVGTAVELAGYGLTETGSSRALRFLVESITQMDASSIVVSGFGASGACDGDSGGPLLVRNPQGSLAVGGVLAMGSSTCNEEDTYLRLDPVLAWIQSTTGAYAAGADACGTIDHVGRCLYGSAVWCDSGGLTAQSCDARGESCGWDAQGGLFRRVDSEADPCRGIDATGACRDNAALRCDHGTLLQTSCAPCGTCRLNSKSGTPACDAL